MEVKLGVGIGELRFGIELSEAEDLLGSFDEHKIDGDDNNRLVYVFNEKKIRLTFYKSEKNRLGYIETSNPSVSFKGIQILEKNIEFIKKEVLGEHIKDWIIDEYFSFKSHFNDEFYFSLHEEYRKVTNIELGVPFKDDEEYNWPKL
ncbi:MAG: hypothetical protein RIE52_01845 [Balneola sp.]|jgi:hypothetical protein